MYTRAETSARVIDQRYRLGTVLGHGAMSTVYAAEHAYTRRQVAVKLLLPALAHHPDMVRRFLDE
ncbi:MAG: hypothetical protein HC834_08480, partial [Rhodospirillales bacterium]|nr:hypothetical protein [Rhodospirillales bacterium]